MTGVRPLKWSLKLIHFKIKPFLYFCYLELELGLRPGQKTPKKTYFPKSKRSLIDILQKSKIEGENREKKFF